MMQQKFKQLYSNKLFFLTFFLFIFSLIINLCFLDWSSAIGDKNLISTGLYETTAFGNVENPEFSVLTTDSVSYIDIAREIASFHIPKTSVRTPTYPLFLAFFILINKFNWVLIAQAIIGAFIPVLAFFIISQFIKNNLLSFFSSILLSLDYHLISYHSRILPESISAFLILVSAYLHIIHIKKNSYAFLFFLFTIDFLLILSKPYLAIIPILFYALKILTTASFYKKESRTYLEKLVLGLFFSIFIIIAYMGINEHRYGKFSFSNVYDINLLGKIIQYDFINDSGSKKTAAPEGVPTLLSAYTNEYEKTLQTNKITNPRPHFLINLTNQKLSPDSINLKDTNRFFLEGNYLAFTGKTITILPRALLEKNIVQIPNTIIDHSTFSKASNSFFFLLHKMRILSIFICLALTYYFIKKKEYAKLNSILIIVTAVIAVIVAISFFSYNLYSRLRVPIEPLLNIISLLPFLLISDFFINIATPHKINDDSFIEK